MSDSHDTFATGLRLVEDQFGATDPNEPNGLGEKQRLIAEVSLAIITNLKEAGLYVPFDTYHEARDTIFSAIESQQDLLETHTRARRRIQVAMLSEPTHAIYNTMQRAEAVSQEARSKRSLALLECVEEMAELFISFNAHDAEDLIARIKVDSSLEDEQKKALALQLIGRADASGLSLSSERILQLIDAHTSAEEDQSNEYSTLSTIAWLVDNLGRAALEHPEWDEFVQKIMNREKLMAFGEAANVRTMYDGSIKAIAERIGFTPFVLKTAMDSLDGGESGF